MKNWYLIPLAAIAGVIAGSWGPREDLARFKESVREEQTNRKASKAAGFDAFAQLANIPDVARPGAKPRTNAVRRVTAATTNAAETAGAPKTVPEKPKRGRLSREDLRARLEEAADLWNTRVELARTQWKGKLKVTDGKASEAFDAAIATMNESLHETMQSLADELEKAEKMTPELTLRWMGDMTRTMSETYDALSAAVPEAQRGELSEMPVFEFIDPMVAEPLVGVQDKLDGGFRLGRSL